MAHALFVLVGLEGVVHKPQEVGSHHQVIFDHDDASVGVDHLRHTVYHVGGEAVVALTHHEMHLSEAFYAAGYLPHAFHRCRIGARLGSVAVDVEVRLRRLGIVEKRSHRPLHVFWPVVSQEYDWGCFHYL